MPELASTRSDEKVADVSIKMAQALRNLQCAVTQSHDAVFITDQAGLITRVNPAFEELTGYSAIQALGKDLSAFIARGPHSDEYREIWARIFQQRAFSGTVQLKKKSGEACEVGITLTPLCDPRGQVTSIVCSCRHSPEESSKAIPPAPVDATQLLDIAHHLNNVLLTVMAYADLTYGSVPPEHPLRFRLLEIKNSAHRASNLARLLLDCDAMKILSPLDLNIAVMPAADSGRAPATAAVGGSSPEFQGANPPTLLVVGDELSVREYMIEFLLKAGYNVLGAGSGEEALEKSKSSAIDLVITNVALPRMSGQQLAGVLAAFHPEMKVLFVSGYSQAAVLQRDAPGLNRAFLQKPFSLPALAEKIDGVLAPSLKARAAAAAG